MIPPRASTSRTRVPFARPPILGLQLISPMLSLGFGVTRSVFAPLLAAAAAASQPACPPPTTITSNSNGSFVHMSLVFPENALTAEVNLFLERTSLKLLQPKPLWVHSTTVVNSLRFMAKLLVQENDGFKQNQGRIPIHAIADVPACVFYLQIRTTFFVSSTCIDASSIPCSP